MSCTKNPHYWTPEEKAKVAELMEQGLSAGKICKHFGVTRNSICGLVDRDKTLKAIGLRGRKGNCGGGKQRRFTDEQRKENARRSAREYYHRQRQKRERVARGQLKADNDSAPTLRVVSSNNVPMMVEDWLKRNGGPRRFERGCMTDYQSLKAFLEQRGVNIVQHQGKMMITGRGRPRRVGWDEICSIADEFRVAEGLTPILRRAS